jgi:hypothetical protein
VKSCMRPRGGEGANEELCHYSAFGGLIECQACS